jgi:hypothetical protein
MVSTIKIDVHRGKLITFDLDIHGLHYRDLTAKFRVTVNEIEYGFEAVMTSDHVDVHLPCLTDIVHDILMYEGTGHLHARLEVYGDHFYYIPWEGELKIAKPDSVTATIKKEKKKSVKEDDATDVNEEQEIIVDDPEEEVTLPEYKGKKKKPVRESVFINESQKLEYLKQLKQIDEEGIRKYMRNAGTKSEKIQNIILEQAEGKCKDPDDKFELLKSVVKVMKELKSGGEK